MLGTEESPGNMVLTLKELFKKIESNSSEREYNVKLSYLEIYNENIRDLLSSTNEENLELREDPSKGLSVSGITELNVNSTKDIMYQLRKGNKNRTVEATNANETSSRSHAILQVLIEFKDKTADIQIEIKYGKLSLIDLAGSERASATHNRGIRLIEGANINRSLLALGNCINALCEANEKGTKPHVPFRDSKLTRLLKDSLGGNSRTVMIANISPASSTFEDTYNTLKYANRAKNIKTQVNRNVLNVQYHISNYTNIINNLKNEISELRNALAKKENPATNPSSNQKIIVEKCIQEIRSFFDEEISLKKRIFEKEENLVFFQKKLVISKSDKSNSQEDPSELENKIAFIKKDIESSEERIAEIQKKRDHMLNSYMKLFHPEKKDIYSEHLTLFVNSQKSRLEGIENNYKNKNFGMILQHKDNLIKEYEFQINLRDEMIKQEEESKIIKENTGLKSLAQIKKDYEILPIINIVQKMNLMNPNKKIHSNSNNIFNQNNQLPNIHNYNVERNVNKLNPISKKEKRSKETGNNHANLYNFNSKEIANNLQNINSNYNSNNYNNGNGNIVFEKERKVHIASANEKARNNRQLSQNPTQGCSSNNLNNVLNNQINKEINILKRKVNSSKKPKSKNKIINFKNKNEFKEESQKKKKKYETSSTEKSVISNSSQRDNTPVPNTHNQNLNLYQISDDLVELDNSNSKEREIIQAKFQRQNNFKEKEYKDIKKIHAGSESPHNYASPIKKEFPKLYNLPNNNGNNSSNLMKKKELNNFLNDRPKQNKSKKPFKI